MAKENITSEESQHIEIGIQVIYVRERQILLGKRKRGFAKGSWGLPGGHLEFGEEFEEAGLRELMEETGIKGKSAKVVGIANTPFPEGIHHVQIALVIDDGSNDEPKNMEPEKCSEWRFFSFDNLPIEKEIFPPSLTLIQKFLESNNAKD